MSELEHQRNAVRKVMAVFGLICMAAGLLVAGATVATYYFGEKSRFWPAATATITSSEVAKFERMNSASTGTRSIVYEPKITYSYLIDSKAYSNDRVSFSPIGGGNRVPSQFYVTRFKVGSSYPVYYDGKNPENSTLIKGTSALNLVAIFSGVVFFSFGIVFYKLRGFYANSIPDDSN